jgi:hypothetical protein
LQAQQRLQEIGQHYAAVLDALPLLEKLWKTAATFDPLYSPSALLPARSYEHIAQAQQGLSRKQALLSKMGLHRQEWWAERRGREREPERKPGHKGSTINLARP